MRILFQSYATCFQNKSGGLQNRIRKFYSILSEKIDVEYFSSFTSHVDDCDLIHFFMVKPEYVGLIRCAKKKNKKVIISTVMALEGGWKAPVSRVLSKIHITTEYFRNFEVLQMSDLLIAETQQEKDFLVKYYCVDERKIRIIPNGSDELRVIKNPDAIFEELGAKPKYILQVGRFDKNKNQMNVIKAFRKTDIHVVFIGGADHSDRGYYDSCLKEAEGCPNMHFLGWIENDSPILESAYLNAELLILPSFAETFGMVFLEGGIRGTRLAASKTLPILDYDVFRDCYTFNPSKPEDIRKVVQKALLEPRDKEKSAQIKEYFSWPRIRDEYIDCYRNLIGHD